MSPAVIETRQAAERPADVVVVGGGPAGSTAAWRLARAGARVVLLDRARFPRVKPCAGWVTAKVWSAIEVAPPEYPRTLQPFRSATVEVDGARRETSWPATASWGILRLEFDDFLLKRARDAGARIVEDAHVAGVRRERGSLLVEPARQGAWTAPLVIGAGGHGCPVARALGAIPADEVVVVARESESRIGADRIARLTARPGTPELLFEPDLGGYGWYFTKGDHLNVGLGCVGQGRELNRRLGALLQQLRADGRLPAELPLEPFRGHAYALHSGRPRSPAGDGFLLVGDAAGLAREVSGEGIGPAVESGRLAADAILESGGDPRRAATAYRDRLGVRFGSGRHPTRDRLLELLPGSLPAVAGRLLLRSAWARRRLLLEGAFGMAQ